MRPTHGRCAVRRPDRRRSQRRRAARHETWEEHRGPAMLGAHVADSPGRGVAPGRGAPTPPALSRHPGGSRARARSAVQVRVRGSTSWRRSPALRGQHTAVSHPAHSIRARLARCAGTGARRVNRGSGRARAAPQPPHPSRHPAPCLRLMPAAGTIRGAAASWRAHKIWFPLGTGRGGGRYTGCNDGR